MIARAALQTMTVRGVALGASLVSSIVTARALGPTGRGTYYYVLMLGGLAVQFSNLGLHASNTYLVAQDQKRFAPLLGNSMWASLVAASVMSAVVLWLSLPTIRAAQVGSSALWAFVYAPCALFVQLVGNLFVGAGRVAIYNAIQLASGLLALAAICLAGLLGGTVNSFLGALVASMLAAASLALVCGIKVGGIELRFNREYFVLGLRYAAKAFVVSLLSFAFTRANVFVLAGSSEAQQLGIYSVAMQFFDVLSIVPVSISTVLFPSLFSSENQWRDATRSAVVTAMLMIPVCVVVACVAEPLIVHVFGPDFGPAAAVTQWILPAAVFMAVASVLSQYLAVCGYPAGLMVIWGAAVVLVVVACGCLAPSFGAAGAAISLSATYAIVVLAIVYMAWRVSRSQRLTAIHGVRI